MSYCPSCKYNIQIQEVKFCPSCGFKLPVEFQNRYIRIGHVQVPLTPGEDPRNLKLYLMDKASGQDFTQLYYKNGEQPNPKIAYKWCQAGHIEPGYQIDTNPNIQSIIDIDSDKEEKIVGDSVLCWTDAERQEAHRRYYDAKANAHLLSSYLNTEQMDVKLPTGQTLAKVSLTGVDPQDIMDKCEDQMSRISRSEKVVNESKRFNKVLEEMAK